MKANHKIGNSKLLAMLILTITLFHSCIEKNIDIFTFKGDMVFTYLAKDTTYRDFTKIVQKAGLEGMLNAYGSYTCFAPTNAAIQEFIKKQYDKKAIDDLSDEQIQYLAQTHIVPNEFLTTEMTNGVLPNVNMNSRYIQVNFQPDTINNKLQIVLNDSSVITSKDNKVYNGVVHGINKIIRLSNYQLPELIAQNPKVSIFFEALKLTGLCDSLRLVKDNSYRPTHKFMDEYDTYEIVNPKERRFAYTVLIEDNELLKKNGINNINDLIRKAADLYPNDEGFENEFTNRANSLNQYISYHLINRAIYINKFFYRSHAVAGYTPDEFFETMLENRIIRASLKNQRITLNDASNDAVQVEEKGGGATVNGVYHLLDKLLVYSTSVESMLRNTRIRFDVNALFPELVNNNIRGSRNLTGFSDGDRFGLEEGYLEGLQMSKDTRLLYLAGDDFNDWTSFQGDELMGLGSYDMTIRLLPIPPGTYELRYGYSANPLRSVTQVYVDGKPIGIPIDLTIGTNPKDPRVGAIPDNQTDDNGFENDKTMRNRGYMKAPNTFCVYFSTNPTTARSNPAALRRIIGTFSFDKHESHTLRLRSVTQNAKAQLNIDFIEFVPKSIINPANGSPESRE